MADIRPITESVLCRRCGYELRGLAEHSVCPECSLPIVQSVGGDTLESADPGWLRRLLLGARLVVVGMVAVMVIVVAIMAISMISGFVRGASASSDPTSLGGGTEVQIFGTILSTIVSIVVVIGAWLMTEPDPRNRAANGILTAPNIARCGLIVSVVSSPWGMFLSQWMSAAPTTTAQPPTILTPLNLLVLFGMVFTIMASIGWGAYFHHVSAVMQRLPSRRLRAQCRWLKWAYPISLVSFSCGGMVFIVLLPFISTGGPMSTAMTIFLAVASLGTCLGVLGYFVTSIWMIVTHWFIALRLKAVLVGAS